MEDTKMMELVKLAIGDNTVYEFATKCRISFGSLEKLVQGSTLYPMDQTIKAIADHSDGRVTLEELAAARVKRSECSISVLSDEKREKYEIAKSKMEKYMRIVTDVLDGVCSESSACAREEISQIAFVKQIAKLTEKGRPGRSYDIDWVTWGEALLFDLTDKDLVAPDNFETVFWNVASRCLNDKEADIVYRHYYDKETYGGIGLSYGAGKETIRQILLRAVQILKRPEYLQMLQYGIPYIEAIDRLRNAQNSYVRAYAEKRTQQDMAINTAVMAVDERVMELTQSVKTASEDLKVRNQLIEALKETDISNLAIPIRAHRSLKEYCNKNGLPQTAYSIAKLSEKEICMMYGVGRKAANEIEMAMQRRFGSSMTEIRASVSSYASEYSDQEMLEKILYETPLESIGFSVRIFHALERSFRFQLDRKEFTAMDVARLSIKKLEKIRNLGPSAIHEIVDVMQNRFHIDMMGDNPFRK